MLDITPAEDVLIVEEIKTEEQMKSGLFVPGTVTERDSLCKARVLRAGPGKTNSQGHVVALSIYFRSPLFRGR